MIVVATSALMAIVLNEPEADAGIVAALRNAGDEMARWVGGSRGNTCAIRRRFEKTTTR